MALASDVPSRPKRTRRLPERFRDFVVGSVVTDMASDIEIPKTHKQAMASPYKEQWEQAMRDELNSLAQHGTWILVPRKSAGGRKVITCRWVYAVKRDEHGNVRRFKARLVIHGFKQVYGVDYTETYAPVIRFETIRLAIYFALQRGWVIWQYDVKTAFLYGDLDEEIYMEQPPGYQTGGQAQVCRLRKSLYGLRQAPTVWNQTLHRFLEQIGFQRLDSDRGLYVRVGERTAVVDMLLTVYVDDLLLMGKPADCRLVADQLAEAFEMTSLGPVKYLLGVEIVIDVSQRRVEFNQQAYVRDVLKRFHMENCNGCATPEFMSEPSVKTPKTQEYLPYRELVGALQYLVSASRPDLAHAVRFLGKFLSNYSHVHYHMAKRVLQYLAWTGDYSLTMDVQGGSEIGISCFTDADYANDPDDRKSVSGYVTMVDGNVISYGSRKQEINAQSTTESEYVAMNEGLKDVLWLVGLCKELKWQHTVPVLVGDNTGCISLTARPGKHSKTKHIENKYHMIRHLVEKDLIRTRHVRTDDMIADIMTKPLTRPKFEHFRDLLKVLPRQSIGSAQPVGESDMR